MARIFVLFIFIFQFSQFVLAQGTAKIVVKHNESITLVVDQEREALLYSSDVEPYRLQVKLEMAENLCAPQSKVPNCTYSVHYVSDHLVFRWSKHPDVTKIGTIVKAKYNSPYATNESTPIELDAPAIQKTFGSKFIGAKISDQYQPDAIKCDSWDWLPITPTENSQLHIANWSAEMMNGNLETLASENRSFTNAEDVTFDFINGQLVLRKFNKFISSSSFGVGLLPFGNISTLHFNSAKANDLCQISIAHNLVASVGDTDLEAHYKEKPNFKVYSSSRSLAYRQFLGQFDQYLKAENLKNVEFH